MERQHHGLIVEKWVKAALKYDEQNLSSYTDKWDIPNPSDGIPVSIKTIKENGRIDLGSAMRQWNINETFRLVLVSYKNSADKKIITSVDNYLIDSEKWKKLQGSISAEEIKEKHEYLVSQFPEGQHFEARKWWKEVRDTWREKEMLGIIVPTAKIDSKFQRRWQCAISRKDFHNEFGQMSKSLILNDYKFPDIIDE